MYRARLLERRAQDGTVFREILDALQAEGSENATIAGWAQTLNANMEARAVAWSTETFPYGSEFNCAWACTEMRKTIAFPPCSVCLCR